MSLTWSIETSPAGPTAARASGRVTEGVSFDDVLAAAAQGPVRLYLGGITQISSTGVREWILFMRALSGLPHLVEVYELSPTLVRQLNMIANFGGDPAVVRLMSIVLPYYCDACENEQTEILVAAGASTASIADELPCTACNEQAEFDDIATSYLAFLKR